MKKKFLIVVITLLLSLLVLSTYVIAQSNGTVTVKTLVEGAQIHGTNGMAFDEEGNLYIASALGREIIIMDPKTGKILDRYGPEDGVDGPDDLAFGPDGSLYWTDIVTGEVGRRTPDGNVTKQFVAPFVNPITFSDDGRLFVAQAFLGDGLYEIDPEMESPPVLILGEGNPALHLNAMDFGPDGKLYAPRQQLNQLVRIDVDTAEVEILTDEFEGSCKFDSQGRLHVGSDDRVLRFDPATGEVTVVAVLPSDGGDNIVFDSEDNLFVSNFRDGSVHAILPNGKSREISPGGMIAPGGIAVLPDAHAGESVYVADFWTVRGYDGLNGQPGINGRGFFFDSPLTAAADGENLILTSYFGNTVEVWNPTTQQILEIYEFAVPLNAIRFGPDLIVAELGTGSVVRLDASSGNRSTIASGLFVPSGLAAYEENLWVADWATGMVWQLVVEGTVLAQPMAVASNLNQPEGLAVMDASNLLVVESGTGRVSRIDLTSGMVSTVADGLAIGEPAAPGWPPTWFFNGITVGQDGDIFVTGDIDNVIYRITEHP
jgi:sugar lactone lactonase YvrE